MRLWLKCVRCGSEEVVRVDPVEPGHAPPCRTCANEFLSAFAPGLRVMAGSHWDHVSVNDWEIVRLEREEGEMASIGGLPIREDLVYAGF